VCVFSLLFGLCVCVCACFCVLILHYSCKVFFFLLCLLIISRVFWNILKFIPCVGLEYHWFMSSCHNFQCECGFADSVRNSWHHFGYGDQCPISSAAANSWNWEADEGTVSAHSHYNTNSQQTWRWDHHVHYVKLWDTDIQVLENYFLVVLWLKLQGTECVYMLLYCYEFSGFHCDESCFKVVFAQVWTGLYPESSPLWFWVTLSMSLLCWL
jgi:hypothetical protein